MAISKKNEIVENNDGSFNVPSQSRQGISYEVRLIGEMWVCNCPDFENRADEIERYKHAFAVKFWIASNTYLQNKPKPKVFAEDTIQCVECASIRVITLPVSEGMAYHDRGATLRVLQ